MVFTERKRSSSVASLRRSGRRLVRKLSVDRQLRDSIKFIRSWFDKPLLTGAVSPSGKALARRMAFGVDPSSPGLVIELGPGTGPVTEALIARGISEDRLILIEFNPDFCHLLRKRFPKAKILEGDAYNLEETLIANLGVLDEPICAVVSSLPLFTRKEAERIKLIKSAFSLLCKDGPFVQFTYALTSPVTLKREEFSAEVSSRIWKNFPPASVWVYRNAQS